MPRSVLRTGSAVLFGVFVCNQLCAAATAQFLGNCLQLTQGPHRLTGTPQYHRAAQHIEQRLGQIGSDEVITQEFATVGTKLLNCQIELHASTSGANRLALLPMRPNGIIHPVTPVGGLTGPLYHAGSGKPGDYEHRSPKGAIVVLDYSAGYEWLRAFRLGAKAVVFTRRGATGATGSHYVEANANLPRFYYPGPARDLPDKTIATIHSEVVWRPAIGRNVLALIRGTNPVFDLQKGEYIVLAAYLDSFGEVPRLSPGARGAVNCAALLEVAQYLIRHRPRRHVLIAFLDAQARGHAGATALYRALDHRAGLEDRQAYLEAEKKFIAEFQDLLAAADPLEQKNALRGDLVYRVKQIAAQRTGRLNEQLQALRRKRNGVDGSPNGPMQIEQSIERVAVEKTGWNDLRRALARDEVTQDVAEPLRASLDLIRQNVALRMEEVALTQRTLKADRRLYDWLGNSLCSLHVSLLLGDKSDRWGLTIGERSAMRSMLDKPGLYTRVQGAFLTAHEQLQSLGAAPSSFEVASVDGTLSRPDLLCAARSLVHSGAIAGQVGIYNVALCTVQENTPREGTPHDKLVHLDLDRFERQASQIGPLLQAVASQRGLSQISSINAEPIYIEPTFKSTRARGPMAMGGSRGGLLNVPLANVIVQLSYQRVPPVLKPNKIPAFDNFQVVRTNLNGTYSCGPYYMYAPKVFGATFDQRGRVLLSTDATSRDQLETRLHLLRVRPGVLALPPLIDVSADEPDILNADTDARISPEKANAGTADGITYWYTEENVNAVKLFGLQSIVALVNGPESFDPEGERQVRAGAHRGVGLIQKRDALPPVRSASRSASDLWRLNEARMQILRSRSIMNSSIEELHGRAEDLLLAAKAAGPAPVQEALAASAYMAEKAVYTRVRNVLDDTVHAVLVLLVLAVPFAYALERLLVGSVNIYRQILWFATIFAVTFLVLYWSHPAFAVAKTPLIIFLGFTILVLSIMVIVIIMRKFEVELKVLQGLTSTIHTADVSRVGTILAAVSMGISSMRRRPLRTGLTAFTIVLLTFTILCFASFDTRTGIIRLLVRPPSGYNAVLFHRVNWQPIPDNLLDVFEGRWSDQAKICPRYWASEGIMITRDDGSEPVALDGALGIDPSELALRADLSELLGAVRAQPEDQVFMTGEVSGRLGVVPGDHVLVNGQRLRVASLINAVDLFAARDIDESHILPVDFQDISNQQFQKQAAMVVQDETATLQSHQYWATMLPDSVVIVSNETARQLGGSLSTVNLYVSDADVAATIAEDMARMLQHPVSASLADGVYRHVLGTTVQASNVKHLVFPLILGGLVVFGTMLGSVADREKEIFSFSALGLAPTHVAGLFFAEAMIYSAIGGLGGYLLAQGSMEILESLGRFGLVRVPEMNYSSMNAIVVILVVMATVLISSIYPAICASRSANPGILRSWRMPAPDGNTFNIEFPFTISQYDFTGVVSFLKEHFDTYSDTGLGVFMAQNVRLVQSDDDQLGIDADMALAPFDLGVTQAFELRRVSSAVEGIDEIRIRLTRRSGQPKDWQRLNRVLLNDIRRQFLIWRSLAGETMEIYRQRTLAR